MYGHLFATPIPHRLYTLEVDDIGDALLDSLSVIDSGGAMDALAENLLTVPSPMRRLLGACVGVQIATFEIRLDGRYQSFFHRT